MGHGRVMFMLAVLAMLGEEQVFFSFEGWGGTERLDLTEMDGWTGKAGGGWIRYA